MLNIPLKTLGGKQFWADERVYSGWRIQRHVRAGRHRLLDPQDVRRARGSFEACEARLASLREAGKIPAPSPNAVILLHGIWRAKESLRKLQQALSAEGYEAIALNYPSTRGPIEEHAAQLARVLARLEGAGRISFVAHSMGALVVRRYLQDHRDARIRRLVMIAPPNRGSAMANLFDGAGVLRRTFGPAGPQMRSDALGALAGLAAPWCEFGVIAGGKGDGRGYNPMLQGDNDMMVEVENTKLDGMADFLLLPCLHTFILQAPEAIEAVKNFLSIGRFRPESAVAP